MVFGYLWIADCKLVEKALVDQFDISTINLISFLKVLGTNFATYGAPHCRFNQNEIEIPEIPETPEANSVSRRLVNQKQVPERARSLKV